MAKRHHPVKKTVCGCFQSVHEHVFGWTFINHLILKQKWAHQEWEKEHKSRILSARNRILCVSLRSPLWVTSNDPALQREIWWSISILWPLLCIAKHSTTAINFLIFSSKKVIFIHEWDRWRSAPDRRFFISSFFIYIFYFHSLLHINVNDNLCIIWRMILPIESSRTAKRLTQPATRMGIQLIFRFRCLFGTLHIMSLCLSAPLTVLSVCFSIALVRIASRFTGKIDFAIWHSEPYQRFIKYNWNTLCTCVSVFTRAKWAALNFVFHHCSGLAHSHHSVSHSARIQLSNLTIYHLNFAYY